MLLLLLAVIMILIRNQKDTLLISTLQDENIAIYSVTTTTGVAGVV